MTDAAQVMVGIDGSPFGDDALRWAVDEGHLRRTEVVALLAWDYLHQLPAPGGPPFDPEYRQEIATTALQALLYRVLGVRGSSVTARAVFGLAAPVLLDQVRNASLLVIGARGLGRLRGLLLGSVSQRCTHLCPVPLAIVRNEPVPTGNIVVGVDGTEISARALSWAVTEARLRQCPLTVLRAIGDRSSGLETVAFARAGQPDQSGAHEMTDRMIAAATGEAPTPPVEIAIVSSEPARSLVDASADAQLLVVGNPRYSSLGGVMLGSVAQQVAHHAQCPTVLVPHPLRDEAGGRSAGA
jgi:nucleotide-binding universal stress UspA family protein